MEFGRKPNYNRIRLDSVTSSETPFFYLAYYLSCFHHIPQLNTTRIAELILNYEGFCEGYLYLNKFRSTAKAYSVLNY